MKIDFIHRADENQPVLFRVGLEAPGQIAELSKVASCVSDKVLRFFFDLKVQICRETDMRANPGSRAPYEILNSWYRVRLWIKQSSLK